MTNRTVLLGEKGAAAYKNPTTLLMAWLGMLLLSRLPQIIALEILGIDLGKQILWLWLGMGLILIGSTFGWLALRPLRGFFVVMTAVYGATVLVNRLVDTTAWQSWFGGTETAWAIRFFGERLGVVLIALLVTAVLFFLGQSRRQIFLVKGNWQAATGLRLPGQTQPLAWGVVGPLVALSLALLFGWGLTQMNAGLYLDWQQLILLSPFVLLFALMNAFGEEMAFRAGPLSQLWLVIGEKQAVWLTAVWFGLGHYYGGIPSGVMGAVMSGLLGLLLGKAMLETKGIALPILMHLLIDAAIYAFLAMTAV
ncbi:MAG TPA: CPBP family intramembrane metalloprotease [Chloroflexota bacterium]|nr:CPBP family intramembrane metalloprotease [Chloroflexota bacterium]